MDFNNTKREQINQEYFKDRAQRFGDRLTIGGKSEEEIKNRF